MRIIIQRVTKASVEIEGQEFTSIQKGLVLLVGIEDEDTDEDLEWAATKISKLRIFADEHGKSNFSIQDVQAEILVLSQFTLFASLTQGNRPSYIKAGKPDFALLMFEKFYTLIKNYCKVKTEKGKFGVDCKIHLINDGPFTIWMNTKQRE